MSRLFNGTSDYLELAATTGLTASSPFTVSAWVKPTAFTGGIAAVAYGGSSAPDYWVIYADSSGVAHIERSHTSSSDSNGATFGSSGTWQHFAAVVASNTSSIVYKDGTAGTTDTTSQALTSINTFDVGCLMLNGTRTDFWIGRIGEVAVWTSALSAGQITSLAGGANPTTIGTPACYWQIKGTTSPEPFYPGYGSANLTVSGTTAEVGDDPPVTAPGGAGIPDLIMAPPHR